MSRLERSWRIAQLTIAALIGSAIMQPRGWAAWTILMLIGGITITAGTWIIIALLLGCVDYVYPEWMDNKPMVARLFGNRWRAERMRLQYIDQQQDEWTSK